MTLAGFLLDVIRRVPHFNYQFKQTSGEFTLKWNSEYVQSLSLVGAVGVALCILLLLTIIIVWICQSCRTAETGGKTRRKVRRLSTVLFVISVICFFLLGFCLFANEHINRGVSISINSVTNIKRSYKMSLSQISGLNEIAQNTSTHLKALQSLVQEESQKGKHNATLVQEVTSMLNNISLDLNNLRDKSQIFDADHEDDIGRLERIRRATSKYESERWAFLVIALSITMCVLFSGVIAFCRQSKKGAVVFSSVGFFIFLVVWTLISFTAPTYVGLGDFCSNGETFTRSHLEGLYDTMKFYNTCRPSTTHDNVPSNIQKHVDLVNKIPGKKSTLDGLLAITFNVSQALNNASTLVGSDITSMIRMTGGIESSTACYVFHDDIANFYYGLCDHSIVGGAVFFVSLLLLGIMMFALLIIVSKTWRLFSRLEKKSEGYPVRVRPFRFEGSTDASRLAVPNDSFVLRPETLQKRVCFRPHEYVEVDDDDPFFPRAANDSLIPVDIYGTHVFNPRSRTEPSTNTTTGTGDEQSAPLWPPHQASAPPPGSTLARSPYGTPPQSYGNYGERYNISQ